LTQHLHLILRVRNFVTTNGFYKDCNNAPKLAISVASD